MYFLNTEYGSGKMVKVEDYLSLMSAATITATFFFVLIYLIKNDTFKRFRRVYS